MVTPSDESKVVVQGFDGYIVAEKNGQLIEGGTTYQGVWKVKTDIQ